jgi:hypothetical protein
MNAKRVLRGFGASDGVMPLVKIPSQHELVTIQNPGLLIALAVRIHIDVESEGDWGQGLFYPCVQSAWCLCSHQSRSLESEEKEIMAGA